METSAGQGEHGTGKSVKGRIRKIPSESGIRLGGIFSLRRMISLGTWKKPPPSAIFKITVVEGNKKSEPISDLENLVRIILVWCGKQDWILAARRRSVSAVLKPHRGLIHCGFFKSVSRFAKKRSPALLPSFFLWCGKQDLNLHEIAFTRT